MNIGGYLNYILDSKNIDKKNIYEKVKVLMESTEGSYITYSRFCNKINSNTLTAKEFVYIASILGETFDCNKFIQNVRLELPANCDFTSSKYDAEMSKLRDVLDTWYDYEVLYVNKHKFDFYKTLPNVKLLDEKTSTINTIVMFIENFSDETEEQADEDIKTGVSEVNYLSYSFETDELRLENVIFGTNITDSSHSPVPHNIGENGHGGYREEFYTNKLGSYLQVNGMTYDNFEELDLADKIKCVNDWLVTRGRLTGKTLGDYLQFDI